MRSMFRRPREKCNFQLTKWVRGEDELQSAIKLLEDRGRPWEIRRSGKGLVSLWTYYDKNLADELSSCQ